MVMGKVQARRDGEHIQYFLDDRPLTNGAELELRLGGHHPDGGGWEAVTVTGLPVALRITWTAADGHPLHTTLPNEAELRWP